MQSIQYRDFSNCRNHHQNFGSCQQFGFGSFFQQANYCQPNLNSAFPGINIINYGDIGSLNLGNILGSNVPFSIQGQQPFYQQPQQGDSSNFMMQMLMTLLPLILGAGHKQPKIIDEEQVKVDPKTIVAGDPSYSVVGKDGKTYAFTHHGSTGNTYNVFQGDGYEVDAKYGPTRAYGCAIIDTKIKAGADLIDYDVNGQTSINGKIIKSGSNITLNDGTKVSVNGTTATITSRDGDGAQIKLAIAADGALNSLSVSPSGNFSNLSGIIGTAIKENRVLTEEEANKFDITNKK